MYVVPYGGALGSVVTVRFMLLLFCCCCFVGAFWNDRLHYDFALSRQCACFRFRYFRVVHCPFPCCRCRVFFSFDVAKLGTFFYSAKHLAAFFIFSCKNFHFAVFVYTFCEKRAKTARKKWHKRHAAALVKGKTCRYILYAHSRS